jgi:hypothetical protein
MGEKRDAYSILVWRSKVKRPLIRLRHRWDNIKIDIQEVGWGCGLDCSGSG